MNTGPFSSGLLLSYRPDWKQNNYKTSEKHVDQPQGEIQLAHLCINYLNLPGFREGCSSEEVTSLVSRGDYAFVDYAFPYWIRHLEDGSSYWVDDLEDSTRSSRERNDLFRDFSESLGAVLGVRGCPAGARAGAGAGGGGGGRQA